MFKPTITAVSRSVFGCLFGATLMGSLVPEAQALAVRDPRTDLNSHQDCINAHGHMSYFGAAMTMSTPTDQTNVWCIHTVQTRVNLDIPALPGTFSYPRDNLKLFIPIGPKQNSRVWVNIPGGGVGGVNAPYRELGNDFEHTLRPIATDTDGQTIWQITDGGEVGLKIWNGSSCGPDDANTMSHPALAVNSNRHHSGFMDNFQLARESGTQGGAYQRALTGCNYNAHVVTQVVLLKPDVVAGRVTIPARKLGTIKLQSRNYGKLSGYIDFDVNLPAMSFTFQPRTCSYSGPKDQTVIMKKVSVQDFFGIRDGNRVRRNLRQEVYSYNDSGKAIGNDTIDGNQFSLILNCSRNANVESYVTFTDNLNPNNTTNILSPKTGTGQAQQVGIKLYLKGREEAINFSPIAFQPGTEGTKGQAIAQSANAIRVGGRSNQAQTHRLDFTAKYARLGSRVTAGKVNAEMVFNFSYY